jgi:hypothetical protein
MYHSWNTLSGNIYNLKKKYTKYYPTEGVVEGFVTGFMVSIPDHWVEKEPGVYYDPDSIDDDLLRVY